MNRAVLPITGNIVLTGEKQALWGDFTYQAKTKRIVRLKAGDRGKPLFVVLALEPIWRAYDTVLPHAGDHKVCIYLSVSVIGLSCFGCHSRSL